MPFRCRFGAVQVPPEKCETAPGLDFRHSHFAPAKYRVCKPLPQKFRDCAEIFDGSFFFAAGSRVSRDSRGRRAVRTFEGHASLLEDALPAILEISSFAALVP